MTVRMLAAAVAACALSASAKDIYVAIDDPNAADDAAEGRGSEQLPYWSIQAAVEAAEAAGSGYDFAAGDVIRVKPGVYTNKIATCSVGNPTRQYNRVVITNNVRLVSTEGKEKTVIEGRWRDDWAHGTMPTPGGATPVGGRAVRCVFIEPTAPDAIVEGFTLTHGATDNGVQAQDEGGGFAAPGGGYLVDCIITNCAGYGAASCAGGTLVRCFSGYHWPYGGSGYIYNNVKMLNSAIFHKDRNGTGAGSVMIKNSTLVNCTVLGDGFHIGYTDCALYNVLSPNLQYGDFNETFGGTVTRENCFFTGNATGNTDIKYIHCVNPFLMDFALMSHSSAIGVGDAKWLVGENAIIKLPARIAFTDMSGNDLSALSGAINAGCSQTVRDPLYGGFRLNGRASVVGGLSLPAHGYRFATEWPCVWSISNATTMASTQMGRTDMLNSSVSHPYLYPAHGGTFLAMVPQTSRRLLSIYQQTAHERLWVDPVNGDDVNGTGAVDNPYRTLYVASTNSQAFNKDGYNTIFELKPGVYKEGGYIDEDGVENRFYMKYFGSARFVIRPTDGPGTVTIVGSTNGTDNVRCILASQLGAIIDVTLADGRTVGTKTDGKTALANAAISAGGVQLTGCVVTNCVSSGRVATAYAIRTRFVDNEGTESVIYPASYKMANCEFFRNHLLSGSLIGGGGNPPLYNFAICGNRMDNVSSDAGVSFVVSRNGYPNNCLIDANEARYTSYSTARAPNLVWNATLPTALPACDIEADPQFVDPVAGDLRVLATSPAVGAGQVVDATTYEDYMDLDIDRQPLKFLPGNKVTMGPHQEVVNGAYIVAPAAGGLAFSGAKVGANPVGDDGTLTFSVAAAAGGMRHCFGVIVTTAGGTVTTNRFADLPGGVWSHTVSSAATSVRVEAFYDNNWYVDAVDGNDSNDGFTAATAKKTLAEVMTNTCLQAGDVVHAAAGRYDTGTMRESDVAVVLNRVIIPSDITLVADEGRDVTFIVGEPAPEPDANGLGTDAVRCVLMQPRARLEGFTVTGGRTHGTEKSGTGHDGAAGGIYVKDANRNLMTTFIVGCDITNCVAGIAHAARMGVFQRCRFLENGISSSVTVDNGTYVSCLFRNGRIHSTFGYYGKVYNSIVRGYYDSNIIRSGDYGEYYNTIIIGRHAASGNTFHGCIFATNSVYGARDGSAAQFHPENYPDCTFTTVEALKLTDALEPTDEPGVQTDLALSAYQPAAAVQTEADLLGNPRVMNGACDASAYEWDIRPDAKAVLGRRVATVDWVSANVLVADGVLTLAGPEASLTATAKVRAGGYNVTLPVTVTDGTLTASVNGVPVATLTQPGVLNLGHLVTGDKIVVSFEGTGSATLGRVVDEGGFLLLVR